jgi:AbrB family looped-hinge helix DNA binding protein
MPSVFGILNAMRTTIDAAGRLVIPKPVRREAGLKPGMAVEVEWRDGHIEIEPALPRVEFVQEGRLLVAVFPDATEQLPEDVVDRGRDEIEAERFTLEW